MIIHLEKMLNHHKKIDDYRKFYLSWLKATTRILNSRTSENHDL